MIDEKNDKTTTGTTVKPVEKEEVKEITEKVVKDTPAKEEKTEVKPSADKKNDKKPTRGGGKRGGRKGGRGRREKAPKEFEETVLQIDRVTRVTKGGRQLRFRISIVIGDKKGRVGFGIGKSGEVIIGIQKSIAKAKRNLINVPIFNETIPHQVEGNFKASKVLLFPARVGKGIIAGGAVRKILELAGVKNVLSKAHGSRNRINVAYATFLALQQLQNKKPLSSKEEEVVEKEVVEKLVEKKGKKPEKVKKPTAKSVKTKKPVAKKTSKK